MFRRLLPRPTYMSYVRLDIRRKSDAARGFIAYATAVASLAALSELFFASAGFGASTGVPATGGVPLIFWRSLASRCASAVKFVCCPH